MHFAGAARDGLGRIDLVVNSAHQKGLVGELGNDFLPSVLQFLYHTVGCFSVDGLDVRRVPSVMFAKPSRHRCFRRCFSKMRCILAGDIGLVDTESDLARRDESDRRLRNARNVEAVGGMRVSSHVECFTSSCHPGDHERVPI